MERFTKRMKFFWTGNYCWNTTFSRVKCKWIRNTWLKFPSKLNSYGLWYKGENCVFPNMAWVLKTSKCWENGLGTQLTFNYDHSHSSIMWQNGCVMGTENCLRRDQTLTCTILHRARRQHLILPTHERDSWFLPWSTHVCHWNFISQDTTGADLMVHEPHSE